MTDREKAIVMAYTGYTMLAGDKLGIFYHYAQEKLGRCIMTHELAYKEVQDAVTEAAKGDFIALAKSNNGWISVKDRLPKDDGDYLVYTREEYIGLFWFDRDEKEWTEESDFPCLEGYVTHWMPLPEPPKEDRENRI